MTTGGAKRAWASLSACVAAAALVTGCDGGTTASAPPSSPSPRSPSPSAATTPEELCTRLVGHWAREVLDSDTYGDYQSMGLSNGQYEILRRVVDSARAEKKHRGADAADESIDREAREGCVAWYRSGGPGEGPWQ